MEGTDTLAEQSGISFVGKLTGKLVGLVFITVVTYFVSPRLFGVYTLAFSIVSFIHPITNLNVHNAVDYFVPKFAAQDDWGRATTMFATSLILSAATGIIGGIILALLSSDLSRFFNEPRLSTLLVIFAFGLPLFTLNNVLKTFFTSIKRQEYRVTTQNVLLQFAKLIFATGFVLAGLGATGIALGHVVAVGFAMTISLAIVFIRVQWFQFEGVDWATVRDIIEYSLPLAFAGMAYATVAQIDFFVLGFFEPSKDVGIYRVGYTLAMTVLIVRESITPVFKPLIVEVEGHSHRMKPRFLLATRWMTMLTLPAAATLVIFPDLYLSIVFRDVYAKAAPALAVLVAGQFLNISIGPTGRMLQAHGKTRLVAANTAILVVSNVAFDLLLTPRLGMLGAAIGTSLAVSIKGVITIVEVAYLWDVHPFETALSKLWVGAIPAVGGLLLLRANTGTSLYAAAGAPILVVLLYLSALRSLDAFSDRDIEVANRIDERLGRAVIRPLIT